MRSGDFKKTRVERFLYWLYAETFKKAHQFWNMLDNPRSSQGIMIFLQFTFMLNNCYLQQIIITIQLRL